jgi:predicted O-linked N-acetylglucosamine transferase (SPINDLY family)
MRADPTNVAYHSTCLFTMQYRPDFSPVQMLAEARRWNELHARPLANKIKPHSNDRSPDRKLRIGYVSADLRTHSVAFFFMPLLLHHDRANFQIFCYSNVKQPDAITSFLKNRSDAWRDIASISDESVVAMIRADAIDILVDLSGHSLGNRLGVFARKPAPIQASYLGYANTTGLATMDYRLTDALADPPGMTDGFNAEKLWRLAGCAWCYRPPGQLPEPYPAPRGPVTFGCFNTNTKINPPLIDLWAQLLHAVPGSRLVLKSTGAGIASARQRLLDQFGQRGIQQDRLELLGMIPDLREHLAFYNRIDVALDTYPYHGTTTTCEALWMGVPTVVLAGQSHMSRVGVSLLTHAGLPEFIAATPQDYLSIASGLAASSRARSPRAAIRAKIRSSPLLDGKRLAKEIESAFRRMWRTWTQS